MAPKSKLSRHAPRIHRLLREGETALAIWKDLKKLGVSVSYEGVRKWIHANPIEGVTLSGPGHPPSRRESIFTFLSDDLPPALPAYLLPLWAGYASPEDIRLEVTKRAFWQLGLSYEEDLPRTEWVLSAERLVKLSDLELCLLVYLLSDLSSPPLVGNLTLFEEWYEKLRTGAHRLKSSIQEGRDVRGKDLFPESVESP